MTTHRSLTNKTHTTHVLKSLFSLLEILIRNSLGFKIHTGIINFLFHCWNFSIVVQIKVIWNLSNIGFRAIVQEPYKYHPRRVSSDGVFKDNVWWWWYGVFQEMVQNVSFLYQRLMILFGPRKNYKMKMFSQLTMIYSHVMDNMALCQTSWQKNKFHGPQYTSWWFV